MKELLKQLSYALLTGFVVSTVLAFTPPFNIFSVWISGGGGVCMVLFCIVLLIRKARGDIE